MPNMRKILLGGAVFAAALFTGCKSVPSDEDIAAETLAMRQKAYREWESAKQRGESKQPMANGQLSIDDAIRAALQYNKQLMMALQNREITRGHRISAWQVVLPTFNASAGTGWSQGNALFDTYNYGFTISQPIVQGEYIPARLKQARLETALTDENIRTTVQNLIANVANDYYQILLNQHLVETQKEGVTSAEAQLRVVMEKRKQETATDYEVLSAQVAVANYRAQMIQAQNNVDNYKVALLKLMGVSQDSQIYLTDKLLFLPMRPILERAVQLANMNRSDLRIAELDAMNEREAVRIAESTFWPAISASLSNTWAGGGGVRQHTNWRFGLNASYQLGASNWGELHSARAKELQAQINIIDTEETALEEIRTQMNSLANAEEQVNALVINQESAREALRLATVGYQAGVKTEADVIEARRALVQAQGEYYNALYQHTFARLQLQVAMGILGPARVDDCSELNPNVPIANIHEFAATDYVAPKPVSIPRNEIDTTDKRREERRSIREREREADRLKERERRERLRRDLDSTRGRSLPAGRDSRTGADAGPASTPARPGDSRPAAAERERPVVRSTDGSVSEFRARLEAERQERLDRMKKEAEEREKRNAKPEPKVNVKVDANGKADAKNGEAKNGDAKANGKAAEAKPEAKVNGTNGKTGAAGRNGAGSKPANGRSTADDGKTESRNGAKTADPKAGGEDAQSRPGASGARQRSERGGEGGRTRESLSRESRELLERRDAQRAAAKEKAAQEAAEQKADAATSEAEKALGEQVDSSAPVRERQRDVKNMQETLKEAEEAVRDAKKMLNRDTQPK